MKQYFKPGIKKGIKILGLSVVTILLLLFLAPIVFPGAITEKIKRLANNSINSELNFSSTRLSFFNHFPSLTLTLYDFNLKGSPPFQKDTLISTKEIAFGINIKTLLFDKKITIDKIFLTNANIDVRVNENGEANYNIYEAGKKSDIKNADTAGTAMRLEKIIIENCKLSYQDQSLNLLFNATGFNYSGNGNLSQAIFDLNSHLKIDSFNFYLDEAPYFKNKKIEADLVTKINTHSLAFFFTKNKLIINKLPVNFTGKFDFLYNGYDLDFTLNSINCKLHDLITALPPQYITWMEHTTIKGNTDFNLTLKGKYIAALDTMPSLAFNMKIREGYIKYERAPFPASNLFLNFDTQFPYFNPDSLQVKIDSLFFNVGTDYFSSALLLKGTKNPFIKATVNTEMNLENLDKAIGFTNFDLKGRCKANMVVEGVYATGPNPHSIRHENTILGIPAFTVNATLKNGYFKYATLPMAVNKINFNINSSCNNNNYENTRFAIKDFSATALDNFIKGDAAVSSLKDPEVISNLQSTINLADIKKIYPADGLDLKGLLKINIHTKGKFNAAKKELPVTIADILLKDGAIKTSYYPNAISNIQVVAKATNENGTLKSTNIIIQPASFQFEGKPFELQAILQNMENIEYDIKAKGELNVGKIYRVFSKKGLDVTGVIKADLSLKGKQSDATGGLYSKLHNEGTLECTDIVTHTEYLPKTFIIKHGLFRFNRDRMWFNNFNAVYGQSDFNMNGYLQHVIEYALSKNAVLKGNFNVDAAYINADEFMAYAPVSTKDAAIINKENNQVSNAPTGVIIIPSDLDLSLKANAKRVYYKGLPIEKAAANMTVNNGKLLISKAGFHLIGCNVLMDAGYESSNPFKALFNYQIEASDFDVKKAYDSIQLFRDMASMAAKAQGIVSLNYKLKGVLDENMQPVYPSLDGSGVLNVRKVKVMGLKILSIVSQKAGADSLKNPDIAGLDIKSSIKNNVITVERFKIKMAGFRLRVEGKANFDGQLQMKMRLGLPPLGIIGIPIRVSGTQENPIIKMGKKDTEEVKETEYKEQ